MRIKSCIGRNLEEAIEKVKQELGEDAIIISTGRKKGGAVELRAIANKGFLLTEQIEKEFNQKSTEQTLNNVNYDQDTEVNQNDEAIKDDYEVRKNVQNLTDQNNRNFSHYNWKAVDLRKLLKKAKVKNKLIEHLTGYSLASDDNDLIRALAYGINQIISVKPINFHKASSVIFVGNVGSGKTVSWAKTATECLIRELDVFLISLDTLKRGAVAQNKELAEVLGKKLRVCSNIDDFEMHIDSFFAGGHSKPCIIDSFACNPFDNNDKTVLANFIDVAEKFLHLEKILVIDAYMSYGDIINQLKCFAEIGVSDVVITKADIGRNIGSMISAIYQHGYTIRGITNSPYIGDEILKINSLDLSNILCNGAYILNKSHDFEIVDENVRKIAV